MMFTGPQQVHVVNDTTAKPTDPVDAELERLIEHIKARLPLFHSPAEVLTLLIQWRRHRAKKQTGQQGDKP